jgi:hypothetical protein
MTELPDLQLNKCRAADELTPSVRQLHQWVLTIFADTGTAPRRTQLEQAARDRGIDSARALKELSASDVLAFDDHGEIRAAYPFSPNPTSHVTTWEGGPNVYAMCAVDALGISAMLDCPVTITTTEPRTDTTITVEVDHDRAQWTPGTAVVLAGTTNDACCPSVDSTCGHINFFTSPHAAQTWRAAHPHITATILDQAQALACGIAEFGSLMRPTDKQAREEDA